MFQFDRRRAALDSDEDWSGAEIYFNLPSTDCFFPTKLLTTLYITVLPACFASFCSFFVTCIYVVQTTHLRFVSSVYPCVIVVLYMIVDTTLESHSTTQSLWCADGKLSCFISRMSPFIFYWLHSLAFVPNSASAHSLFKCCPFIHVQLCKNLNFS